MVVDEPAKDFSRTHRDAEIRCRMVEPAQTRFRAEVLIGGGVIPGRLEGSDLNCPLCPGDRVGMHQLFLNAVFPTGSRHTRDVGTAGVDTVICPICSGWRLRGSR